MPDVVFAWLALAVGIVGVVWSADRFVAGSAALALNLGVSKLVIGLTLVSLGTSAPEILVALNASLADQGDLAIGNALGSNIANLGLVLAVTLLVAPMPIRRHIVWQELPVLVAVTLLAGLLLVDHQLVHWEGWLLALLILPLLYLMFYRQSTSLEPLAAQEIPALRPTAAAGWFVVGLLALIGSAHLLVSGATDLAHYFGVSNLIVGLTLVALGTSLPELAAAIASALKGHHDIALGNIIGSNVFNLLAVMAIPGMFGVAELESAVFSRDYLFVAGTTGLLAVALVLDYWRRPSASQGRLGRLVGGLLLLSYIGYFGVLYQNLH